MVIIAQYPKLPFKSHRITASERFCPNIVKYCEYSHLVLIVYGNVLTVHPGYTIQLLYAK